MSFVCIYECYCYLFTKLNVNGVCFVCCIGAAVDQAMFSPTQGNVAAIVRNFLYFYIISKFKKSYA